jgi:hypothetical protein
MKGERREKIPWGKIEENSPRKLRFAQVGGLERLLVTADLSITGLLLKKKDASMFFVGLFSSRKRKREGVYQLFFLTLPAFIHLAQALIFIVFPSTTALTDWRLGRNLLLVTPVMRWPTPPLLLAIPLRLIVLPATGFFPQT